jgi:ribose-phosphate pyrophosphokinase
MINTGATLILAARTLHEKGAKSVHVVISHGMFCILSSPTHLSIITLGLLSEANMSLIDELPITQLVVCTLTCMFVDTP